MPRVCASLGQLSGVGSICSGVNVRFRLSAMPLRCTAFTPARVRSEGLGGTAVPR